MPLTTVFEIGPGTFTVVLYPTPTSSSQATTTITTSSHLTTRTATRSIDKNVHQVNTSLPLSTSSFSTDGVLIGQTTVISGSTYTLGLEPFTYTSNGGVYTSVRVQRGAIQTGSEEGVGERNKRWADRILGMESWLIRPSIPLCFSPFMFLFVRLLYTGVNHSGRSSSPTRPLSLSLSTL